MEISEKIRIRDTEIQRAWDNVHSEIQHLEMDEERARKELRDLQQKLSMAKNMRFQIRKKAERLKCTEIL